MKVGEKARLVCPSNIAYGDSGRPPTIPGGATLVFEIELLGITTKPATSPQMSLPQAPPSGHPMMPGGRPFMMPKQPVKATPAQPQSTQQK